MESSQIRSSETRFTGEELTHRQDTLGQVIEEAKNRGDSINENYLLYKMNMKGFKLYSRNMLYKDRLELDSQSTYIRDFIPRYSAYQQNINAMLDEIDGQAKAIFAEKIIITKITTKTDADGNTETTKSIESGNYKIKAEMLKVRTKVAELKQKHAEGHNINISAAIIQRELINTKKEIDKLKNENVIKVVKDGKKQ